MFDLSGETGYIHEPFLPTRSPGWLAEPLPFWFMYITEEIEVRYLPALTNVVNMRYPLGASLRRTRSLKHLALHSIESARSVRYRMRGVRPLLKDPMAIFSSEWLADRFAMDVVVMIRNPLAFVSSIKRLNWGFDYERHWLGQDLLMRDLLGHRAEDFRGYRGEIDLVGEGIVMWNAIYDVVARFRDRRPDWHFVIYENLAADPVAGFRELYEKLDLTWSDKVAETIARYSKDDNPKEVPTTRRRAVRRDSAAAATTWRERLSAQDVERIAGETADVARFFYPDSDLLLGPSPGQRAPDEAQLVDSQQEGKPEIGRRSYERQDP